MNDLAVAGGRLLDPGQGTQAIARAREHPDVIVGIKVRLGFQMVGDDPAPAMRLAREAAETLGLPLMVHVIDMRPSISWLLPYLDRGDIVTHCFHGHEGGILDADGQLRPDVWRARERGVRFDVGHGAGSFSYQVARSAITQGFPPDTVSSDLHAHNVAGPVYDQATTLSKLLHAGMPLTVVIRATTATPALAIRAVSVTACGAGLRSRTLPTGCPVPGVAGWPEGGVLATPSAPEGQRARALLPGSAGRPPGKEVAAGVRYRQ